MKKRFFSVMLITFMLLLCIACALPIYNDMNTSYSKEKVRYQDDFYEAVNGNLLDQIELEEADAQWTWFGELSTEIGIEMRQLIAELAKDGKTYQKGSSEQKIKDLYECISNKQNRDMVGLGPLQPHLDTIRNATTIDEYVDALAYLSGEFGFSSLVGGYMIDQDRADSEHYAVYLMYADTLIGKEYLEDPAAAEYVNMYFEYVEDMLKEFGMDEAKASQRADDIEELVRDICSVSLTAEQYYNPSVIYNVYDKAQLQDLYTNIDVDRMLKILRLDEQDHYIVMDVGQAQKVNSLLVEDNLELLKDFSTFVMLNDAAEYSTTRYAKLSEDINNSLRGVASRGEEFLWMEMTQEMLPWDFASIYVDKHCSKESKEEVEAMIVEIIEEYKKIIDRQSWMCDSTKKKAKEKLDTMNIKIGYPDEWPESKDMMVVTPVSEGGSLLSNMLVNMNVGIEDALNKLDQPVDKSNWAMTPQTINAYYDPNNNEIVFPAGILQAPFYDKNNSRETNLGGIGYVIAHEISHAFDSNGALYDANGNYNVWWTQEELEKYDQLSKSIVDYYSNYSVAGGKVNGEMTLSENIADLGAITCITDIIGDDKAKLDRAFSQMAFIWASDETVSYQLYLLNVDTHSPNKVRVNATLSSCDAFYNVYDIQKTDKMYVAPDKRVGIWK